MCSRTLQLEEILRKLLRDPANARKAVIVGCTDSSMVLAKRLRSGNQFCLSIVGFFDDRSRERLNLNKDNEIEILGTLEDLPQFVRTQHAEVVFVALPVRHMERVMRLMEALATRPSPSTTCRTSLSLISSRRRAE